MLATRENADEISIILFPRPGWLVRISSTLIIWIFGVLALSGIMIVIKDNFSEKWVFHPVLVGVYALIAIIIFIFIKRNNKQHERMKEIIVVTPAGLKLSKFIGKTGPQVNLSWDELKYIWFSTTPYGDVPLWPGAPKEFEDGKILFICKGGFLRMGMELTSWNYEELLELINEKAPRAFTENIVGD